MQTTTRTYRSALTAAASHHASQRVRQATVAAFALLVLVTPGVASAADTLIAPDTAADQLAALDGTVAWVSGAYGDQVLMQRTPDGVIARVKSAPRARTYDSIDLGRDRKGRLVLTYERCTRNRCTAIQDDLDGKRARFKSLTRKRCSLSRPAMWGTRVAYGLWCTKPNKERDEKRSGLYVKTGDGPPKRLRLPADAVKSGSTGAGSVDLRGTRVAAITGVESSLYAFTQTVAGTGLRSIQVAYAEGPSYADSTGVSLGSGGVMWALENEAYLDAAEVVVRQGLIHRVSSGCSQVERLVSPPTPNPQTGYPDFRATDLVVDRSTLYLIVPGAGIVEHRFAPETGC